MDNMTIELRLVANGFTSGVEKAKKQIADVTGQKTTKLDVDVSAAKSKLADMGKQFLAIGAGAFAAQKLLSAFSNTMNMALQEARNQAQVQRLLESQIRTTGAAAGFSAMQMNIMAEELQNLGNIADDAILQQLTIPLSTFKSITGPIFEETQRAILDMNAVLGDPNNPASLSNVAIQVGKALQSPSVGLTALKRSGVSFTESQIEMIKELEATNRLAEAQAMILAELKGEFGGAYEAAKDAGMQWKNTWGDFLEGLGMKALPIVNGIQSAMTELFGSMAAKMNDPIEEVIQMQEEFGFLSGKLLEYKQATNLSNVEQKEMEMIIQKLNQQFPNYFQNVNLTAGGYSEIARAVREANVQIDDFIDQTILSSVVSKKSAEIAEIAIDKYDLMKKKSDIQKKFNEGFYSGPDWSRDATKKIDEVIANIDTKIAKLKDKESALRNAIIGISKGIKPVTSPTQASSAIDTPGVDSGGGGGGSVAVASAKTEYQKLLEELDKYQAEREMSMKDGAEREMYVALKRYEDDLKLAGNNTQAKDILYQRFEEEQAAVVEKYTKIREDTVKAGLASSEKGLATYYEAVKFADSGYYGWKQGQITAEVAALELSTEQSKVLTDQRLADLTREKDAYQSAPVTALIQQYKDLTTEMSNTSNMGVQSWVGIRDSLTDLYNSMKAFAGDPAIDELLKKLSGQIDVAQMNAAPKAGNWFFSGVLGFDPDSEKDKAKVQAVKDSFRGLQNSVTATVGNLLTINSQRREDALKQIETQAEAENWSEEQKLARQAEVNKRYDSEERKLKRIQKNISIATAVMNVAEGATKALAAGPILGPILAAMITALGAVQIGTIRAQKFATGGLFKGKGGPTDDQNLAYLSNGEYIVNARSTQAFLPMLEAMNAGNIGRTQFAPTGSMNSDAKMNELIDAIRILNLNLVKKDMSVVINSGGVSSTVRKQDTERARMTERGYVPSL